METITLPHGDCRKYLIPGDVVSLRRLNAKGVAIERDIVSFSVTAVREENDSSVCYDVRCEKTGVNGRLKEFYPLCLSAGDAPLSIDRNAENQLVVRGTEARGVFSDAVAKLKEGYRILLGDGESDQGGSLRKYIPPFELFEGRSKSKDYPKSLYVWTPDSKKTRPFSEYLEEVRKDLEQMHRPEHHMFNILNAVYTLAKCVCALHAAGLTHGNIHPGNFGLAIEPNGETESGDVTLYGMDMAHLCEEQDASGENRLQAQEADIRAVGTTLFRAVLSGDGLGAVSEGFDAAQVGRLIANAKLVQSTDKNSNAGLVDMLVGICEKTLGEHARERYDSCDKLAEDLRIAANCMLPQEANDRLKAFGREVKVNSLDTEESGGATEAIQQLLFEHPLYEYAAREKRRNIDVLVLGAGTYAMKFIDLAFEMCQIPGHYVRITAVSDNTDADCKRYLEARPAFADFFSVEGVKETSDPYGTLAFVSTDRTDGQRRSFARKNEDGNKQILDDVTNTVGERCYSYVFIALGNDLLNFELAKQCAEVYHSEENPCGVHYMCYGTPKRSKYVHPVSVNNTISESKYYDDLKRMALNAHLLWESTLNVDFGKIKDSFENPYNFRSSFSNVLSVKYKLHGMGIELDNLSREALLEAARMCAVKLQDIPLVNRHAMYEHRRWVTNYICQGWNVLTDYSSLQGDRKDKARKLHPCIVRSSERWTLRAADWANKRHRKWDAAADLTKLDALDRVSVELHRHFLQEAEKLNNMGLIQRYVDAISDRLQPYPVVLKAFERFVMCLREIVEGKQKQTRLYENYSVDLKAQFHTLPPQILREVESDLSIIESTFFPVLQSRKYTDYKEEDQKLISGIPFILTYSTDIHLCVPFGIEAVGERNNRVLFGNVAAARAVNPAKITYIIDAEDVIGGQDRLLRALRYAVNCIKGKKMQTAIRLLFLQQEACAVVDADLKTAMREISENMTVEIRSYQNDEDLRDVLNDFFEQQQNDPSEKFTALERNTTGISKLLRGFGCYQIVSGYSYDTMTKAFTLYPAKTGDAEVLGYIRNTDSLMISDMFYFKNKDNAAKLPEMEKDYEFFWGLYKSANPHAERKEDTWKKLCAALSEMAKKNDKLCELTVPKGGSDVDAIQEVQLFIPAFCRQAAEKIVYTLKDIHVDFTGASPTFAYHTSQMVCLTLKTSGTVAAKLEALFANPYRLHDASAVRLEKTAYNKVAVCFDNLRVRGLEKDALSVEQIALLQTLYEKKYILSYSEKGEGNKMLISFAYASPQIKSLLTNEGKLFELYVYYKLLEKDFDEVLYSCEVVWNDEEVSHEFDIVAVKGQKALLIETKATRFLKQEFYYRLAQLNQRFGINALPVLVADTLELDWQDNSANDMQRSRGKELGVETVYRSNDIIEVKHANGGVAGGVGAALQKLLEEFR